MNITEQRTHINRRKEVAYRLRSDLRMVEQDIERSEAELRAFYNSRIVRLPAVDGESPRLAWPAFVGGPVHGELIGLYHFVEPPPRLCTTGPGYLVRPTDFRSPELDPTMEGETKFLEYRLDTRGRFLVLRPSDGVPSTVEVLVYRSLEVPEDELVEVARTVAKQATLHALGSRPDFVRVPMPSP